MLVIFAPSIKQTPTILLHIRNARHHLKACSVDPRCVYLTTTFDHRTPYNSPMLTTPHPPPPIFPNTSPYQKRNLRNLSFIACGGGIVGDTNISTYGPISLSWRRGDSAGCFSGCGGAGAEGVRWCGAKGVRSGGRGRGRKGEDAVSVCVCVCVWMDGWMDDSGPSACQSGLVEEVGM